MMGHAAQQQPANRHACNGLPGFFPGGTACLCRHVCIPCCDRLCGRWHAWMPACLPACAGTEPAFAGDAYFELPSEAEGGAAPKPSPLQLLPLRQGLHLVVVQTVPLDGVQAGEHCAAPRRALPACTGLPCPVRSFWRACTWRPAAQAWLLANELQAVVH